MLVIGDGPERAALEARAQATGLADVIQFVGWQRPLHRWYEAMDLLLLPSRTEGLPNVVLEAMAMGVPTAATHVGGVGELIEHNVCGLLLPGHERHWAACLFDLLHDSAKRARFVAAAQRRVRDNFTFTQRMHRIMDLYDALLATAPAIQPQRRAAA